MLAAAAILLGIGLGLAVGGSPRSLTSIRIEHETAFIVAFALQGVVRSTGWFGDFTVLAWSACAVCIIATLADARRRPGVALMMLGTGLNALVVLLNSGMPVVVGAADLERAADAIAKVGSFYHLSDATDWLAPLGDTLLAPGASLASLGDLLLLTGVIVFLAEGLRAARLDEQTVHSAGEMV